MTSHGPAEREAQGQSGPAEREAQGQSGPAEREAQGPSGPAEPVGEDLDGLSFEDLVERLEALTAQLADGGIGIERAADLYERAQRLHAAAAARLEAVANRIDRL